MAASGNDIKAASLSEADVQRCSVKEVILEISQNLQESTCARVSFLIKLQASFLTEHLRSRR